MIKIVNLAGPHSKDVIAFGSSPSQGFKLQTKGMINGGGEQFRQGGWDDKMAPIHSFIHLEILIVLFIIARFWELVGIMVMRTGTGLRQKMSRKGISENMIIVQGILEC